MATDNVQSHPMWVRGLKHGDTQCRKGVVVTGTEKYNKIGNKSTAKMATRVQRNR